MFRLWAKTVCHAHMVKDLCVDDASDSPRTRKVFRALDQAVREFDLSTPIWLDKNIAEFRRHGKTRFYQDNFIEQIPFDYLEIHVIEED